MKTPTDKPELVSATHLVVIKLKDEEHTSNLHKLAGYPLYYICPP